MKNRRSLMMDAVCLSLLFIDTIIIFSSTVFSKGVIVFNDTLPYYLNQFNLDNISSYLYSEKYAGLINDPIYVVGFFVIGKLFSVLSFIFDYNAHILSVMWVAVPYCIFSCAIYFSFKHFLKSSLDSFLASLVVIFGFVFFGFVVSGYNMAALSVSGGFLLFTFFAKYLENQRWKYAIGMILSTLMCISNIAYFYVAIVAIAIYAIAFLYFYCQLPLCQFAKKYRKIIYVAIGIIFVNSFWIFPSIYLRSHSNNIYSYGSGSDGTLDFVSYFSTPKNNFAFINYIPDNYLPMYRFYGSLLYVFFGYTFIIVTIFLIFFKKRKPNKLVSVFLVFFVCSFSISLGKNFLLWDVFDYMPGWFLLRVPTRFFMVSLFSLTMLFFLGLGSIRRKHKYLLAVTLIFVNMAFFISGNIFNFFKNAIVPGSYYIVKEKLSLAENDQDKVFLFPGVKWYHRYSWVNGYDTPNMFDFISSNPLIVNYIGGVTVPKVFDAVYEGGINGKDAIAKYLGFLGTRFALKQKDIINDDVIGSDLHINGGFENIFSSSELDLSEIDNDYFLPHFYTPERSGAVNRPLDELPEILASDDWKTRSAVFFKSQNQGKDEALAKIANAEDQGTDNLPTLEFRKINPTKYRVRIHAAQGQFPLVFSESFHDGWKAYLEKASAPEAAKPSLDGYRVLDGNSDDQASADELKDYVSKGWVTDLGNGREKTIEHKKWEDGKEKKDYDEQYRIGFVSQDFQGTIQNDNLPSGSVFETWLRKPIAPADHLEANGYANAWLIDPEALCQESGKCLRNPDGSYDMEIVVEFWPQRLFYIGLAVSGTTVLSCLGYLAWDHRRKKKEEAAA